MSIIAPLTFNYSMLPQGVPARKKVRRYQPENSSVFSPSSTSVIRIPVRDNAFLDGQNSYLKFKLKNTSGTAGAKLKLDYQASAIITRLRILVGGVVAEDIERVNLLNNVLTQVQGSEDYHKALQIISGVGEEDADNTNNISGAVINQNTSREFCIPIFSGLLNCGKYLPLNLFKSNSLTIELYLENAIDIGLWYTVDTANPPVTTYLNGTAPAYEVSSVEYIASLIELTNDSLTKQLEMQMMTSGLEFHGTTYSTHINSQTAGTSASINIPERCKSLKALMTVFRPLSSAGNQCSLQARYPHTTGGSDFNFNYRVGSELLPQTAVSSSAMAFVEFQKAYNHLFDLKQSCYANSQRWNTPWATSMLSGCFNMTISTESYSHTGAMESGIDTASGAVPISLQISNMNINSTAEVVTWAYKDVIWRFDATGQFLVSL